MSTIQTSEPEDRALSSSNGQSGAGPPFSHMSPGTTQSRQLPLPYIPMGYANFRNNPASSPVPAPEHRQGQVIYQPSPAHSHGPLHMPASTSSGIYTPPPPHTGYTDPSSSVSPRDVMSQFSISPYGSSGKRQRGRLPTACETCRKRKTRCDGDGSKPCGPCVGRGVADECTYTSLQDASNSALHRRHGHSTDGERRRTKKQRSGHRSSASGSLTNQSALSEITLRKPETGGQRHWEDPMDVHTSIIIGNPIADHSDQQAIRSESADHRYSARLSCINSISRTLPVSSERTIPVSNPSRATTPKSPDSPEAVIGNRFWRSHSDVKAETETIPSAGRQSGNSSDTDPLMEENEAHGVGSMRAQRGPWDDDDGEKTFFGTSHFGPQLAAKVIRSNSAVRLSDVRLGPTRGTTQIDRTKPYTLESQTRELVSLVPSREESDRYVRSFFDRYNAHNDIIPETSFMQSYGSFWQRYNTRIATEVDLRQLALLLIVLAFGTLLDYTPERMRSRREAIEKMELSGDQAAMIEGMINDLESQSMSLKDREEKSSGWCWAARRALSESASFFGESLDTIRAGLLMSLYLNVCRRVPEAWTAIGTAIRAAQAQGLHVDGSSWKGMSSKEAELRRRLWAQLYIVDRSISLFLGRPVCIQDGQFTTLEPANLHDDELDAPLVFPRPLTTPTKTTFLILHFRLARIIGTVQLTCFNLAPRRYADVMACERKFQAFKDSMPSHFRLDNQGTDLTLDTLDGYKWLPLQRQTLNSKFHLARISLHRPYIFRSFAKGRGHLDDPYSTSREPLLYSSIADLGLRIDQNEHDPLDRFKWMTVASGFFSSSIIGILCHMGYHDSRVNPVQLRGLLQQYIALEEKTVRRDEALEMELNVLRLMEARALEKEQGAAPKGRSSSGRERPKSYSRDARHREHGGEVNDVRIHTSTGTSIPPSRSSGPTSPKSSAAQPESSHCFNTAIPPRAMPITPVRFPYDPVIYDPSRPVTQVGPQAATDDGMYALPSAMPPLLGGSTWSSSHTAATPGHPSTSVAYAPNNQQVQSTTYYGTPYVGMSANASPSGVAGPQSSHHYAGSNNVGDAFTYCGSTNPDGAGAGREYNSDVFGNGALPFPVADSLQEWLMPYEGDPTASGLPDASEGMAWQAILSTNPDCNWNRDMTTEKPMGSSLGLGHEGLWKDGSGGGGPVPMQWPEPQT